MIPYGKDSWRRNWRHGARRVARGPRVRAVPARRPGHRQLARRRPRRVHRGRDPRRVRRRRVAGGPAVVQRQRRHVGHQLRRLHVDPGREAPAAAPARDPADVRDRRPLPRRRPHPRRLRDREREEPVRGQPAGHERDAAAPAVPRRRAGATSGGRGSRRRRRGCSRGSASRLDGPYWRRGSLAPDYDALECAVFQVAGWTRRLRRRRRSGSRSGAATRRVRTLVGNWVHSFPDDAYPGPNLDWLHELVRFFDRYLKGVENGWERRAGARPGSSASTREPEAFPAAWPGRWRAADAFPVAGDGAARAGPGPRLRARCGAGRLRPGPAAPSQADRRAAAPGDRRARRGAPLVGRRAGRPTASRATSARTRRSGLTYTCEPLADAALDPRRARGRSCSCRLDDAGRDLRRPAVRGGARRRVGARRDRRPEPDPPPVGHVDPTPMPPGSPRRPRRSGSRCAPPGYRFSPRPPDPADRPRPRYWPVLWPSPFPGELRRPPRRRRRRRASCCRCLPRRRRDAPAPPRSRTEPGRDARGRARPRRTSRSGGSRRTCSAGR